MICPGSDKKADSSSFFEFTLPKKVNLRLLSGSSNTKAKKNKFDTMFQICLNFFLLPMKERIIQGNYEDINLSTEISRAFAVVQCLYTRRYSNFTTKHIDIIKLVSMEIGRTLVLHAAYIYIYIYCRKQKIGMKK